MLPIFVQLFIRALRSLCTGYLTSWGPQPYPGSLQPGDAVTGRECCFLFVAETGYSFHGRPGDAVTGRPESGNATTCTPCWKPYCGLTCSATTIEGGFFAGEFMTWSFLIMALLSLANCSSAPLSW